MTSHCQYSLKNVPLTLNSKLPPSTSTIIIFLSSSLPHPSSACLILLPQHSIRLLNTILTLVINNRLVIPLSINILPSRLRVSEALQFLSPLEVWFTCFLTVCPGLFSPHHLLCSLNLCCVSFSAPLRCLHVNLRNTSTSPDPHPLQKHHSFTFVFCRISTNSLEIIVKLNYSCHWELLMHI